MTIDLKTLMKNYTGNMPNHWIVKEFEQIVNIHYRAIFHL